MHYVYLDCKWPDWSSVITIIIIIIIIIILKKKVASKQWITFSWLIANVFYLCYNYVSYFISIF